MKELYRFRQFLAEGVIKENIMVSPIIMFGGKKYIEDVISSPDDFGFDKDDAEWVKNNILSSPKMVSIQDYMDLDDKWVKQAQIDTSGGGALDHVVDGLKIHVKQELITPEQEKEAMKVVGLSEGVIKEDEDEVDVNKILSNGGYDEIDDEELLATVKSRLKGKSNIGAKALNLLIMKIEDEEGGNIDFSEGKLSEEEEVDVDIDVEDEVEVEAGADDIEIERPGVKTTVDVGLSPEEEVVQDSLTAAMKAAQELGNTKLADQIGNTITFFTREFVVGQNTD